MANLDSLEERMKHYRKLTPKFIQNRGIKDYNDYFKKVFPESIVGHIKRRCYEKKKEKNGFHWVDVCCGYGAALRGIAAYHFGSELHLTGIDCMKETDPSLEENIRKYGRANYEWIREDMALAKLERPADLMTCIGGLNYVSKRFGFTKAKLKIIRHLFSQLSPGGIFLFADHGEYRNKILLNKVESVYECRMYTLSFEYNSKTVVAAVIGLIKK